MKTPNDLLKEQTGSFLRIRFAIDGGQTLELQVPTFWDDMAKIWIATIQTPHSKTIVKATAKNSRHLEQEFLRIVKNIWKNHTDPLAKEIFDMFDPIYG